MNRRILPLLLLSFAAPSVSLVAESVPAQDIRELMTVDQFAEAGLDKLSPEELAALNTWLYGRIERERQTASQEAEAAAQQQLAATQAELEQAKAQADAAEAQARDAAAKIAEANERAQAVAAATPPPPPPAPALSPEEAFGLEDVAQAKGEAPREADAIETTIVGEFRGWDGYTRFKLANGQVWMQAESGRFRIRKMEDPKVTISRGMMGAYYLSVEGYGKRVKVTRVR